MRFLNVLLLIGLIALAGGVRAQDASPVSCYDPDDLYDWSQEGDTCSIEYEVTVTSSIDVGYPQSLADRSPFAASVMRGFLRQERILFYEDAEGAYIWELDYEEKSRPLVYKLKIDYELFSYSENIVTVVFKEVMTGVPGYPFADFRSFTFDLNHENKFIDLEDLFLEDVDPYQVVSAPIIQQLKERVPLEFLERLDVIEEARYYYDWALTPSTLEFFFSGLLTGEEGEDVTYRVSIPLEDLKDYLRPEFLPKP